MWNPFKWWRKSQEFNFDFKTFYNLFQYLVTRQNVVSVFVEGLEKEAEMSWYEFPYSYESAEGEAKVLASLGFNNYYELLNKVHEKANVSAVDCQHDMAQNHQYNLLVFNFYVPPNSNEIAHFRKIKCTFYLFFVEELGSGTLDSFRIFYSRGVNYTVKDFLDARFLVNINRPDPEDKYYVKLLEKILAALSLATNVPINKKILKTYPNALLSDEVSEEDFAQVLQYLNYTPCEDNVSFSKELYTAWTKDWSVLLEENSDYDDGYFPLRFEFLEEGNTWHSDWKFDIEEISEMISYILDEEDWQFFAPEATYSHDLFPYIQEELAQQGLELMQMDTLGDSYQFFITKQENVVSLLYISNKLKLGVERLM